MEINLDRLLINLNKRDPASAVAIEALEHQLGEKLPVAYVGFLKKTNGGEGFIGKEAYMILWAVEDIASMNHAYEAQKYTPGLLLFGSDGGGEAFGFDTRSRQWPIVQVPFVGMAWHLAQPIGAAFDEFLVRLYEIKSMCEVSREKLIRGCDCRGKEIFEITPVILGGSPTDPANKTVLTRADHIKAVIYWNEAIKKLRDQCEDM
jgi:hypothetical protein